MKYLNLGYGLALCALSHGSHAAPIATTTPQVATESTQESDIEQQLETTTVTARRRTEKSQEVPASVEVLQGKQLEPLRLTQLQDIAPLLPGLSMQYINPRQTGIAIRGIGYNPANEGLETSAGIYLDNVYLGRPGMAFFDLLDIEQLDLYRGPQGTLFGKNTTAGVLNISTKAPVFRAENSVEVSMGARDYRQFKAMLNQAINEVAALRISAYDTREDGWVKNLHNGDYVNDIKRQGVRAQLLLKPDPSMNVRLIAEHHNEDSGSGVLVPYRYGPWNPTSMAMVAFPPFVVPNPLVNLPLGTPGSNATTSLNRAIAAGAGIRAMNPKDYTVNIDGEQRSRTNQNALSAELNKDINGYKLTSITAWRNWRFSPRNDIDQTDLDGGVGGFKTDHTQYSQEIRLASPQSETFDYVLGAYYLHQNIQSEVGYDLGPAAFALTGLYPDNSRLAGSGYVKTNSYAVFGQGVYHLTEQLDITAGLRATLEKKTAEVNQERITPVPAILLPLFDNYNSGVQHRKDESLSTLLSGSYRFNDDLLAYLSFSSSEKSGGYNIIGVASPGSVFGNDILDLDPEKARSVELGFKSQWLDQRLRFNASVFVTKVRDYQAITGMRLNNAGYTPIMSNVGDITSQGLELSLAAQANRYLNLGLSAAYIDATFDNGSAPTPLEEFNGPGGTLDSGYGKGLRSIKGNRVNGSPKLSMSANAELHWKPASTVEHYVSMQYAVRSEVYADINNSMYSRMPGYGILNLATGLRMQQGKHRWDLSLWARNALDKRYFYDLTGTFTNAYGGSAGQPRTLGASLRYDF